MRLYDGTSSVTWVDRGTLTKEQMEKIPELEQLLSKPSVLIDDGVGTVSDWRLLTVMCAMYGIEVGEDARVAFNALVAAMSEPASDPNSELLTFAAMQLVSMAPTMTDEQALSVPSLFSEWAVGQVYEAKQVVRYQGELYRIAQKHTAQEQYKPGEGTESLYTHIVQSGGYDVWQQPTGAHDAYAKGTRVWYPTANSQLWESLIDGNTWSPEGYPAGWKKVG